MQSPFERGRNNVVCFSVELQFNDSWPLQAVFAGGRISWGWLSVPLKHKGSSCWKQSYNNIRWRKWLWNGKCGRCVLLFFFSLPPTLIWFTPGSSACGYHLRHKIMSGCKEAVDCRSVSIMRSHIAEAMKTFYKVKVEPLSLPLRNGARQSMAQLWSVVQSPSSTPSVSAAWSAWIKWSCASECWPINYSIHPHPMEAHCWRSQKRKKPPP